MNNCFEVLEYNLGMKVSGLSMLPGRGGRPKDLCSAKRILFMLERSRGQGLQRREEDPNKPALERPMEGARHRVKSNGASFPIKGGYRARCIIYKISRVAHLPEREIHISILMPERDAPAIVALTLFRREPAICSNGTDQVR